MADLQMAAREFSTDPAAYPVHNPEGTVRHPKGYFACDVALSISTAISILPPSSQLEPYLDKTVIALMKSGQSNVRLQ
jgi:hypothetical protein